MKMTPGMLIIGGLIVYWASISIMIVLPMLTIKEKPSEIWTPMSEDAQKGLVLYVKNGCSYCHSLYIRVNDWGHGAERISKMGDNYGMNPLILGTERTGPDLSMEGGQRPDDWHYAHFVNPRFTSPISVMPTWEFLGERNIKLLTAYVQYMGGTIGKTRDSRQTYWKTQALHGMIDSAGNNIKWLHSIVPPVWCAMPNPYDLGDPSLDRGKAVYEWFCMGCHGPIGDGNGPAAKYLNPRPVNFTSLRKYLIDSMYIGGIFYYQIMNGVTGTAMPYFKKVLESEKIWDVSNYVAVSYVGYSDANLAPTGINAAYEIDTTNPYTPPHLDSVNIQRQFMEHTK